MVEWTMGRQQRAESGQSSELWRAGQSRDVTLSRHWWDVTRNWLQAVLPGPCVTVRPGLLCHDTGQRKHRTRGHGLTAQLYGWVKTKQELEINPLIFIFIYLDWGLVPRSMKQKNETRRQSLIFSRQSKLNSFFNKSVLIIHHYVGFNEVNGSIISSLCNRTLVPCGVISGRGCWMVLVTVSQDQLGSQCRAVLVLQGR